MATPAENLLARRAAICEELAELASGNAGGLPNASGSGTVDHVGYKDSLYRELREIDQALAAIQGPVEVESYGLV